MTEDQKKFIDESDYETLLRRWRYAPAGDSIFQGEAGKYYSMVMFKKRNEEGHDRAVAASKKVGWGGE